MPKSLAESQSLDKDAIIFETFILMTKYCMHNNKFISKMWNYRKNKVER